MMAKNAEVIYWDASAILSVIFKDKHSRTATSFAEQQAVHFISSLSFAEVSAVISRLAQAKVLSDVLIEAGRDVLERGPWRKLNMAPAWHLLMEMSKRHILKGADLWHLAAAKQLSVNFPELLLLTFDDQLTKAAKREGLIP